MPPDAVMMRFLLGKMILFGLAMSRVSRAADAGVFEQGGKERTAGEFGELFASTASPRCLIEADVAL